MHPGDGLFLYDGGVIKGFLYPYLLTLTSDTPLFLPTYLSVQKYTFFVYRIYVR